MISYHKMVQECIQIWSGWGVSLKPQTPTPFLRVILWEFSLNIGLFFTISAFQS